MSGRSQLQEKAGEQHPLLPSVPGTTCRTFQKAQPRDEGGRRSLRWPRAQSVLRMRRRAGLFRICFPGVRAHVNVCARTHAGPERRYLEILVKYLSFLVFPEDIIQETIKRKLSMELELV